MLKTLLTFTMLIFASDLYAASSCRQLLGIKQYHNVSKGKFTGQEISAFRSDNFDGTPIEDYSSYAQLKAGLLNLGVGESTVIGSLGRFDDVQDFVTVVNTDAGLKVFLKRKYFTIEDARHEFYMSMEREALAKAVMFGSLRFPKAIGFEGNELFLEFVEGVQLREFLKSMPFDELQETAFLNYKIIVESVNALDSTVDLIDGTRGLQVWEYEEPTIGRSFDIFGKDRNEQEALGGLILLDVNRVDRPEASYGEEGLELLGLSSSSILIDKNGNLYHTMGNWRSLSLSSSVGADD